MPLMDYFCEECMIAYEVIVPLDKTEEKITCPKCKKVLKKLVSAPYFKIK